MKKVLSLLLAGTLVCGLGLPALATELPEGWTPADGARMPVLISAPVATQYSAVITVDGKEVDLSGIPGAPAGYIPMRVVTEATNGVADWQNEEGANNAFFFFDNSRVSVDLNTMAISVEFEALADVEGYLDPSGYTFVPVSVLEGLPTVTVNTNPEMDVERYDIVTSASDPMEQLVRAILEATECAAGQKSSPEEMDEYLNIRKENFKQVVGYFPMMISADTVVVGEVAEGKMEAAREDLEARRETTIKNFETYLPHVGEVAKQGQIVESPDGKHIMLIISGNNEKAIELFNAAYPAE